MTPIEYCDYKFNFFQVPRERRKLPLLVCTCISLTLLNIRNLFDVMNHFKAAGLTLGIFDFTDKPAEGG